MKTGYIIRENGRNSTYEFEDTLKNLQSAVDGMITITRRRVWGCNKEFLIVADDEGLLKNREITAVTNTLQPALVGTLLILNQGDGEDFASLTEGDIDCIEKAQIVIMELEEDKPVELRKVLRLTQ